MDDNSENIKAAVGNKGKIGESRLKVAQSKSKLETICNTKDKNELEKELELELKMFEEEITGKKKNLKNILDQKDTQELENKKESFKKKDGDLSQYENEDKDSLDDYLTDNLPLKNNDFEEKKNTQKSNETPNFF